MAVATYTTRAIGKVGHNIDVLDAMDKTTPATSSGIVPSGGKLKALFVNNTADSSTDIWVKIFDSLASTVSPGTTPPRFIFKTEAGVALSAAVLETGMIDWHCIEGYPVENGLTVFASKENGNTATDSPSTAVRTTVFSD